MTKVNRPQFFSECQTCEFALTRIENEKELATSKYGFLDGHTITIDCHGDFKDFKVMWAKHNGIRFPKNGAQGFKVEDGMITGGQDVNCPGLAPNQQKQSLSNANQNLDVQDIQTLLNRLGTGSPSQDYDIIWKFRSMGDVAVPALKEALRHSYDWIGNEAEEALRKIGTPLAKEALKYRMNRQRVNCINCRVMHHDVQFPLDQEIKSVGKPGLFKSWDTVLKCSFCGSETGIKFGKKSVQK